MTFFDYEPGPDHRELAKRVIAAGIMDYDASGEDPRLAELLEATLSKIDGATLRIIAFFTGPGFTGVHDAAEEFLARRLVIEDESRPWFDPRPEHRELAHRVIEAGIDEFDASGEDPEMAAVLLEVLSNLDSTDRRAMEMGHESDHPRLRDAGARILALRLARREAER